MKEIKIYSMYWGVVYAFDMDSWKRFCALQSKSSVDLTQAIVEASGGEYVGNGINISGWGPVDFEKHLFLLTGKAP
jgi:hypothetical protein